MESRSRSDPAARRLRIAEDVPTDGRVVVPVEPGPLVDLAAVAHPRQDELDQAIDELFGDPIEERPGRFDVALVAGGGALVAWSVLGDAGAAPLWLGAAAILLGLAIPVRSLVRRLGNRRLAQRVRRLTEGGLPLDTRHLATRALTAAYASLLEETAGRADRTARDAVAAAHRALVEVATLLAGAQPAGPAEIEYIQRRARAIQTVTARLLPPPADGGAAARSWVDQREARRREAVIRAREELDELSRTGSIHRLEAIARGEARSEDDALA